MIARNVNFAGRESKIIDWYENVPKAIDYVSDNMSGRCFGNCAYDVY